MRVDGRGESRARVHWLQHVPFEGLGSIAPWLEAHQAQVTLTRLFEDARLPPVEDLDWLIVMGGPMSVNDEAIHPWLGPEKRFIAQAISRGTTVLGICLGAQLIAGVLGARVSRSPQPEIGWFPIEKIAPKRPQGPTGWLPQRCTVFHWHGETFDLPAGALPLARSEGCENQGFTMGTRVIGLQFHLETTPESARAMIEAGRAELVPGRTIQAEKEILASEKRFRGINGIMSALLDSLPVSRG